MRDRRGQTTVELAAIFSTVAMFVGLSVVLVRICLPQASATVASDAYYVARDVTWAVDGMTIEKAQATVKSHNRRLKRVMAPRRLKKARDPLAELNLALNR